MKNGITTPVAPVQPKQENGNGAGKPKKTRKQTLIERLTALGVDTTDKSEKVMERDLRELKDQGITKDGRKENGGHENVGRVSVDEREPTLVQDRASHLNEIIEITITERGTRRTEKRTTLLAILDRLRQDALSNGNKPGERTQAAHEYFDRTLGKAPQDVSLKHSGEVGTYTAKRPSRAALAAKKAYAEAKRRGD